MSKPSIPCAIAAVVLPGALACLPLVAQAQVYKCRQADGTTSFQSSPCPGSIKAPVPATPVNRAAKSGGSASEPYFDPYAQAANSGQRGTLALQPARPVPAAAPAPQAVPVPKPVRAMPDPATTSPVSAENERIRQENEQIRARNKVVNCNNAKQQLGVVQAQRPIYTTDNKGERHYAEDKDRQKIADAAQQRVNAECN